MEITFENVTYKENINTPLEKTYLRNLSFSIKKNKITVILGDSESGKTEIGKLINAVTFPTSGKVRIGSFLNDGGRIKNINNLRMNIGFLRLNPNTMLFSKTVRKELEFGIKYFNYKTSKKGVRCADALKLVGLDIEYLDKKISDLTLLEKKKVALASILVFNPKVIILDEPTLGLGTKEKESLKKLIKLLKEKYSRTVIVLTKDTDFAYGVADETFLIYKGSLISNGNKSLMEDALLLNNYNLKTPEIISFINEANKKGANLTATDNVLDLIKEVYRNAK